VGDHRWPRREDYRRDERPLAPGEPACASPAPASEFPLGWFTFEPIIPKCSEGIDPLMHRGEQLARYAIYTPREIRLEIALIAAIGAAKHNLRACALR
jgi:hypothetical protein